MIPEPLDVLLPALLGVIGIILFVRARGPQRRTQRILGALLLVVSLVNVVLELT